MKIIKKIYLFIIVSLVLGVNSAYSNKSADVKQIEGNNSKIISKEETKVNNSSTTTSIYDEEKEDTSETNKSFSVSNEDKTGNSSNNLEEDNNTSTTTEKVSKKNDVETEKTTPKVDNQQKSNSVPKVESQEKSTTLVEQYNPPPKELTEWEKLGISEYEYFNTPLIVGDYKDFDNSFQCNAFLDIIETDLDLMGGWQDVLGKYTGGIIGCRVRIYIDGKVYSLNEFKNTLFFTNEIRQKINAL